MKRIIVGFSYGNGPLSWAIKKVLKTEYSHTYLRVGNNIYEADLSGVVKLSKKKWDAKGGTIIKEFLVIVTDERFKQIIAFAEKHANENTPYGTDQLIWNLFDKLGLDIENINNRTERIICSEFIAYCLAVELCLDPEKENFDLIDPKEVFELVDKIDCENIKRIF